MSGPPQIHQLTPAESAWVTEQLRRAEDFVKRHANAAQVTVETLEIAWQQWVASGESDPDAAHGIISAVATAFGQSIAEVTPLKWVMARDGESSDLALFAFAGKGDLLIVPTHIVTKRWEKRETGFFAPVYTAIVAQADRIAKLQQPADVPLWKRLILGPGAR